MNRLKEIEERLSAIAKEAETDGADLEALNKEVDELTQERSAIIAKEESRKSLLGKIADGSVGTPAAMQPPPAGETEDSAAAIGNGVERSGMKFPIAEPYSKFSVFFDYTFLDNSTLSIIYFDKQYIFSINKVMPHRSLFIINT